ncbi:hypothetical protein BGZ94_000856 [Podila epigama]|nr:hypothetical protein BGZ94_000856 [Podila epigama]
MSAMQHSSQSSGHEADQNRESPGTSSVTQSSNVEQQQQHSGLDTEESNVAHEDSSYFEQGEDEDSNDNEDYYDPQDDAAQDHAQEHEIADSWLEWAQQNATDSNLYQNYVYQKPGSEKRRDRRDRYAQLQSYRRHGSPSSSSSSSSSTTSESHTSNLQEANSAAAAIEKLRRLGTYRPALASSLVHSYSNLSWEAVQAAREKRLAAKAAKSGSGENVLCTLAVEILSHIMSYLDPGELFSVSRTCQLLYHVVNADSCWKGAFMKFFGCSIPFKRLDSKSWRGEYIKRTRLLRRWEKGRGSNISIDPKIGNISKLCVEFDNRPNEGWFLAGSVVEGAVARCNPLEGKVEKSSVLRYVELLNDEVSAMTMDRHRILWGLSSGQVLLRNYASAPAGTSFQKFVGFHRGPVSCVLLVPNKFEFVLTGGVDGTVRVWDVAKERCVHELKIQANLTSDSPKRIDFLCCEPNSYVVAGTSTGEIYVWDVNLTALVASLSASSSGESSSAMDNVNASPVQGANPPGANPAATFPTAPRVAKLPEPFKGVHYLEVAFGMGHSGLIMAQAVDSMVVHLYSLQTLTHLATLKSPAHFSGITAIHWDMPKVEKPMVSESNSRSPGHSLHGRQEMSSLVATGDATGNICLWYLHDIHKRHAQRNKASFHASQLEKDPLIIEPISVLKGHESRITSLFVDNLVLLSGGADGWVKAWNPVNGNQICVLNGRYTRGREVNNIDQSAVKCIAVNGLQCRGLVAIGGQIRSWDFSPEAILAKVQNDIRHSLQESLSQKQLESQAKERLEQLHKRYNNLEGLNMVDMTDEEIVEYVMMLSKDQDEKEQMEQELFEIEQLRAQESFLLDERTNGGEGSSSRTSVVRSPLYIDEKISDKEREEEEALVQRAIEMSMLDSHSSDEDHGLHGHLGHSHSHSCHSSEPHEVLDKPMEEQLHRHVPTPWDMSAIIDVDNVGAVDVHAQEDQQVVQSVLEELLDVEDTLEANKAALRVEDEVSWPSIVAKPGTSSQPEVGDTAAPTAASSTIMSWSQVAKTTTKTATTGTHEASTLPSHGDGGRSSRKQPLIIKSYERQEQDFEDEETQLARILSLSMIEK